jgi:hypothetical protein
LELPDEVLPFVGPVAPITASLAVRTPRPKVTIDYGDGRKLERTLTGNSIHYILDSSARPIDAIPGLYGPSAFRSALVNAEAMFKSIAGKPERLKTSLLKSSDKILPCPMRNWLGCCGSFRN